MNARTIFQVTYYNMVTQEEEVKQIEFRRNMFESEEERFTHAVKIAYEFKYDYLLLLNIKLIIR